MMLVTGNNNASSGGRLFQSTGDQYGETLSAERPFVFWCIRVSLAFSPFGGMRECARRGVSDGFSDPGGGRRGMILARNGKKS